MKTMPSHPQTTGLESLLVTPSGVESVVSRRDFMRNMTAAGLGASSAPWMMNLAAMGAMANAVAQTNDSGVDYKALVCIFLVGGNDNGNTVIPFDNTSYQEYKAQRGHLAINSTALSALQPGTTLPGNVSLALSPHLTHLTNHFNANGTTATNNSTVPVGILLNVGPLLQVTNKTEYLNGSVSLPPKLFSHLDQQRFWQSLNGTAHVPTQGWGGRLVDTVTVQPNVPSPSTNQRFSAISVTGNSLYVNGASAAYRIASTGPLSPLVNDHFGQNLTQFINSSECRNAYEYLTTNTTGANHLENAYVNVTRKARDAYDVLSSALSNASVPATDWDTGDNELADQLKMVAQLIAARTALGMKRQVFMVNLPGFDLHDKLAVEHPVLLQKLDRAMHGFHKVIFDMGLNKNVTSFTASDFGRTVAINGDGSDHGWGSHHFIMGGDVKGNAFYGTWPGIALGHPNDVGQGRLLPSTSVDQYAATLAAWLGVPPNSANLSAVAPNIANFTANDPNAWNLGFMASVTNATS